MRLAKGDIVFLSFVYVFLGIVTVVILYPLIYVFSASVSDPSKIVSGEVVLLPKGFSFAMYSRIFNSKNILIGYRNTVLYTVIGTMYNIFMTIIAAYPLSKKDFKGNSVFTFIICFTMLFSGGMIPAYLNIKNLGLLNNPLVMILPGALSATNFIILRNYFMHFVPGEVLESALVDGASQLKTLWSIVLPLSGPILAVLTVYYAVGHWNSYFSALLYLQDDNYMPLQIFLRRILLLGTSDGMTTGSSLQDQIMYEGLKYALIVVAVVPMVALYLATQKHFKKGIMIGAIKGLCKVKMKE
ncbi:MAG TPA: carbohydrate ABC transporter permease [Candidatus Avimonas sp.]|nr:carbohydrate ABC transporter permease [Candidatus Avimonas sp.]